MKTQIAALALLAFASATAHAQIGSVQKHDTRIERLLDKAEWEYEIDEDGDFVMTLHLDSGRSHLVWINSRSEKYASLEIREIWAVGYHSDGVLSGDLSRKLLQMNHQYKLGAWKIIRYGGKEAVAFYAQISADADQELWISTVLSVMTSADDLEEELTGEDTL